MRTLVSALLLLAGTANAQSDSRKSMVTFFIPDCGACSHATTSPYFKRFAEEAQSKGFRPKIVLKVDAPEHVRAISAKVAEIKAAGIGDVVVVTPFKYSTQDPSVTVITSKDGRVTYTDPDLAEAAKAWEATDTQDRGPSAPFTVLQVDGKSLSKDTNKLLVLYASKGISLLQGPTTQTKPSPRPSSFKDPGLQAVASNGADGEPPLDCRKPIESVSNAHIDFKTRVLDHNPACTLKYAGEIEVDAECKAHAKVYEQGFRAAYSGQKIPAPDSAKQLLREESRYVCSPAGLDAKSVHCCRDGYQKGMAALATMLREDLSDPKTEGSANEKLCAMRAMAPTKNMTEQQRIAAYCRAEFVDACSRHLKDAQRRYREERARTAGEPFAGDRCPVRIVPEELSACGYQGLAQGMYQEAVIKTVFNGGDPKKCNLLDKILMHDGFSQVRGEAHGKEAGAATK